MTEFKFTIDQIKDIYRAGIRQGIDEATAFDWGSSTFGNQFDECADAIHDIVNEGKAFDDPEYVSYSTVRSWFAA
jgi:hypothetical protein